MNSMWFEQSVKCVKKCPKWVEKCPKCVEKCPKCVICEMCDLCKSVESYIKCHLISYKVTYVKCANVKCAKCHVVKVSQMYKVCHKSVQSAHIEFVM